MRAAVFRAPGTPIEVEEVDLAHPRAGEVRVRIAAAGVCHSDLHVRDGDWPLPVPMVLGHEGSGTVVETGPGVDELAVGDHVVLSGSRPAAPAGRAGAATRRSASSPPGSCPAAACSSTGPAGSPPAGGPSTTTWASRPSPRRPWCPWPGRSA